MAELYDNKITLLIFITTVYTTEHKFKLPRSQTNYAVSTDLQELSRQSLYYIQYDIGSASDIFIFCLLVKYNNQVLFTVRNTKTTSVTAAVLQQTLSAVERCSFTDTTLVTVCISSVNATPLALALSNHYSSCGLWQLSRAEYRNY